MAGAQVVVVRVTLDGPAGAEVVQDVSYDAVGCSISQASASVLTDLVIGKPVDEAMSIHQTFLELMQGKGQVEPDEDVLEDGLEDAEALPGDELSARRRAKTG